MISYSCFSDLRATNGSAIFQDSAQSLNIICCLFQRNRVTKYGGSVYFANGALNITKTVFTKSCSTAQDDDVGGNAIYQNGNETIIEHVSSYLCAIIREESGDSAFMITSTECKIEYLNSTSNSGHQGASSIRLLTKCSDSYAKFLNTIKVGDSFAIESWASKYTVYISNFIGFDKSINAAVVWEFSNNSIKFDQCCFFDTNSLQFSMYDLKCEIVNCKADYDDEKFTYFIQLTTHDIKINPICDPIYNNCLTCYRSNALSLQSLFSLCYIFLSYH